MLLNKPPCAPYQATDCSAVRTLFSVFHVCHDLDWAMQQGHPALAGPVRAVLYNMRELELSVSTRQGVGQSICCSRFRSQCTSWLQDIHKSSLHSTGALSNPHSCSSLKMWNGRGRRRRRRRAEGLLSPRLASASAQMAASSTTTTPQTNGTIYLTSSLQGIYTRFSSIKHISAI